MGRPRDERYSTCSKREMFGMMSNMKERNRIYDSTCKSDDKMSAASDIKKADNGLAPLTNDPLLR